MARSRSDAAVAGRPEEGGTVNFNFPTLVGALIIAFLAIVVYKVLFNG